MDMVKRASRAGLFFAKAQACIDLGIDVFLISYMLI